MSQHSFIPKNIDLHTPEGMSAAMVECGHSHIDRLTDAISRGTSLHFLAHLQGQDHGDSLHDRLLAELEEAQEDLDRALLAMWS